MPAAELRVGWGGRRSAALRRVGLLLSGLDLVKVECGGPANAPQPAEFLYGRTQPPAINDEAVASNCLNVIFLPVLTQNLAATSSAPPSPPPAPLHLLFPSFREGRGERRRDDWAAVQEHQNIVRTALSVAALLSKLTFKSKTPPHSPPPSPPTRLFLLGELIKA